MQRALADGGLDRPAHLGWGGTHVSLRRLLFQGDVDEGKLAAEYLQPALYLDEQMRLEDALRAMQRSGQRLGIVLTRERRELGVVSLEDILKAVFGEVSL